MKKAKIYFHPEYFLKNFNGIMDIKKTKRIVAESINEAWEKLVKVFDFDISFIKQIDIVTRGSRPQIMPLVTRNGVVIRLDLSMTINCEEKENVRSIIYHEIYHLADRIDPKFKMDYHLDAESKQKKLGKIINVLWDLYIEKRKFHIFKIRPIYCKDKKNRDTVEIKEASKKEFLSIIGGLKGNTNISDCIFNEIWSKSGHMTYSEIYSESMRICPKEEHYKSDCC